MLGNWPVCRRNSVRLALEISESLTLVALGFGVVTNVSYERPLTHYEVKCIGKTKYGRNTQVQLT